MLTSIGRYFAKKGNDLPRTHISMVGFMNAGKSTIMNAITQQPTSIVDSTPGTTADTKVALMEIHALGPCKLIDTAGIDEKGTLGRKKYIKTESAVKESDVVLFVIDPTNFEVGPFREISNLAVRRGKKVAVVLNKFENKLDQFERTNNLVKSEMQKVLKADVPILVVDAQKTKTANKTLVQFIAKLIKAQKKVPVLPPKYVGPDKSLFLNIPLDIESPSGRLLRPQTMMIEFALRKESPVTCFCMNLKKARSNSSSAEEERARFLKSLESSNPALVVTDSQAIDVMAKWTPDNFLLTTFSIAMANIQSDGNLKQFIRGIDTLANLKKGDKVLICETCNHDRIGDDIGTVQIPTKLKKMYPDVEIDWAFGRAYEDKNLKEYALALHCGGCMISKQQMNARIQDLAESGVPISNYGLALSWLTSPKAFERVLKPWK
ncbi:small GTP-binding protein, putative [Trichomonas vaginalis G3]|uniref:Small GTP-binding protein, putative n=1 Tax=Trichomonas vaginalis (strain ATCC PRA-98 / G3) TaxID=412133 RepID=A2FFR8_TRIV3|nr:biotin synthase protein [Trichomonas vaginalis G3]EAX96252.1 small GTP-binding protein, putative [Trichomonas vaginalis G3]KAI5516239.1 biotin synthase protein [Trichomonas vaginalis G3]|eukprot:XP_001309182.1 small GTP-binding protein [Trichomonas vaginalis G3]